MKEYYYLTFSLNKCLYGISTTYVDEIFYLPELMPLSDTANDIVGALNLRGNIVPVMDLNLSFGYPSPDYCLTDSVVVLRWQDLRLGVIVNEVHEVINISPDEITGELSLDPLERESLVIEQKDLIEDISSNTGKILIMSKIENLLIQIQQQKIVPADELLEKNTPNFDDLKHSQVNSSQLLLAQQPVFCPSATPQEREIFRQRADELKLSLESQDLSSFKTLAVISLNDNFFGIDLKVIQEFTNINKVTPIPCCPPHIVGNMNIRGEILTLVEIRELLNLPVKSVNDGSKVMVVEIEDIVAGVVVEEVHDVMFFLNPLEITTSLTMSEPINSDYLQGVAPYGEKMMGILDLPKLFLNGGLIVDEVI